MPDKNHSDFSEAQRRSMSAEGETRTPDETTINYFIREYCAGTDVTLPLKPEDEHAVFEAFHAWYGPMSPEDMERFKKLVPTLMRSYLRSTKPL